jgi:hypothetical protein
LELSASGMFVENTIGMNENKSKESAACNE